MSHRSRFLILVIVFLICAPSLVAYSVLTHEQIIDIAWDDHIRPLLRKRFPQLTEEQLREAHAYAYGGAVIQDLGYYPFGSKEFSDLVHYVRSGDFVEELIRESKDANEYAFALGALAHYAADTEGHPAVNQSVAIEFPKLRRKFGPSVTYDDSHVAHIRTEFGFDVAQVAKHRYASEQYRDFIGFEVSEALLERAFPHVYGTRFEDVIKHEDLAIGTYRWSVSSLVPKMTKVAKLVKGDAVMPEKQDRTKEIFLYHISRADYEKQWGRDYQRPGVGSRILAFFLRILPKVGPLKALSFKPPTPQTQDLFFKSIDATVHRYQQELHAVDTGTLKLDNIDFDTGKLSKPGEYRLCDETYAKWLDRLAEDHFANITPLVRTNILEFYADPKSAESGKKHKDKWRKTMSQLEQLKAWKPAGATARNSAPR